MSDPVEYPQGTDFPGVIGSHHAGVEPRLAGPGPGARRRAERPLRDPRRCRVRPAQALRPHTTPLLFELEGLSCGYDFGAPASEVYAPPFAFTGTIRQVAVDLAGELIADDAAVRLLMARQ